MERNHQKEM